MAVLNLHTQRGLTNDMLTKGIIDSIVTVNQFYKILPFKGIHGNALAYNREKANTDQMNLVGVVNTGATSINKDQQEFSRVSTELTTIIGDAQVNGLIQAVGSDYNDATAVQMAAKAKGVGRKYMDLLINGNKDVVSAGDVTTTVTGAATDDAAAAVIAALVVAAGGYVNGALAVVTDLDTAAEMQGTTDVVVVDGKPYAAPFTTAETGEVDEFTAAGAALYNATQRRLNGWTGFDGIDQLVVSGQSLTAPTVVTHATGVVDGEAALQHLDHIIDRCHDKDGMVDYIMMNSGTARVYSAALRAVGSLDTVQEVKTAAGGVMSVHSYRGVPIFRNDFINAESLAGNAGGDNPLSADPETGVIYAGTIDDGSFTHGVCGLTAQNAAGIQVQKIGAREDVDADITRIKWYCGLGNFSELGLVKGGFVRT
jgi:hypothetical protein